MECIQVFVFIIEFFYKLLFNPILIGIVAWSGWIIVCCMLFGFPPLRHSNSSGKDCCDFCYQCMKELHRTDKMGRSWYKETSRSVASQNERMFRDR